MAFSSWSRAMPGRSGGTTGCSARRSTSRPLATATSSICGRQLAAAGRRLWMLDITSDLGIPAVIAVSCWTEDARERVEVGAGAHFDRRIAALRAVSRAQIPVHGYRLRCAAPCSTRLLRRALDWCRCVASGHRAPHGKAGSGAPDPLPNSRRLDRREQVLAREDSPSAMGRFPWSSTRRGSMSQYSVARVIVLVCVMVHRRFASARLDDVPVKLGLRKRHCGKPSCDGLCRRVNALVVATQASSFRRQINVAHEQRVDAGLLERGDRLLRRANDRLVVIE